MEEEVWRLFSDDRERLAQVALFIESAVASGEVQDSAAIAESLDIEAVEGRILTVLHRQRERSRSLVERKKQQVQEVEGRLACEACAFDFGRRYGERGLEFIECHHTKAIETLGDGKPTRLSELALLCSNCHRMIHSKRPWLSLQELIALLR